GTCDGDAILDVAGSLKVAARQGGGVHQNRQAERSQGPSGQGIVIEEGLRRHGGNKYHRGDGPNIKTANIVCATQIEAAVRGHFLASVSGDKGGGEVQADGITALVDRVEVLDVEDVGEGVHIAAQGPARE